ncbi:MAG: gliding motility-associated C-terminal domain-containing protein [Thermonemataceae bacterium]|nr:gliding motility-associated C-terminal domain-containing protein [Thermonemataceae bacterium]
MKISTILCVAFVAFTLSLQAQHGTPKASMPIHFTENKNQWDKNILYRADLPNGFLFAYQNMLQYSFYDGKALDYFKHRELHHKDSTKSYTHLPAHSFVVEFVKAHKKASLKPLKETKEKVSYYLGNDPTRWAENVNSYEELAYQEIYRGISYRIFSHQNALKYEFWVEPQADARQIKMHIKYATATRLLPDGSLEIQTSVGSVYEKKPYSYQLINDTKVEVPTEFVLKNNQLSFYFPKGYNHEYPLVIDPELIFSTYSGGRSDNWATTATPDKNGRLYAGGTTYGTDFPNVTGAIKIGAGGINSSGNPLISDVAIFRYNANGSVLEKLIYIGGNSSETPHSLVVDNNNNLLIFGTTSSTNFPTNLGGSFQGGFSTEILGNNYANGSDIFVMKLNTDGSLNRSRLLGGAGNDGIKEAGTGTYIHNYGDELRGDIYVDVNNDVFIASTTRSATISGFFGALFGSQDALLIKLDNNLNLQWGTYFGGAALDFGLSVKTNAIGEIYVGGGTTSTNFPATTGTLNPTAKGSDDGFIAKFSSAGTLLAATYLGTSAADMAFFIDLDAEQEVYAFGQTFGSYPISASVYNNTNGGQFIHKISPDLTTSRWSTRIGSGDGQPDFSPTAFLVVTNNNCGNIYIAGWGGAVNQASSGGHNNSSDTRGLPTTSNAYRSTSLNGSDFYLAVFKKDMQGLLYGTFFGENATDERGDHVDGGTSRFSKDGTIYHAVCASCGGTSGFPTTTGAWANANSSANCNNAAFKFSFDLSVAFEAQDPKNDFAVIAPDSVVCVDRMFLKNLSVGADNFQWQIFNQGGQEILNQSTQKDFYFDFTASGIYTVTLTVFNASACVSPLVSTQSFDITLPGFVVTDSVSVCKGESLQLSATGAETYTWSPSTYLDNPTIPNPIATPQEDITYTLVLKNDSCIATRKVKIKVDDVPNLDFEAQLRKDCFSPYSIRLKLNVPDSLLLDITDENVIWNLGDGTTLQGISPEIHTYQNAGQTYTLQVTYLSKKGCKKSLEKTITIPPLDIPANVITPNGDGINETFEIAEGGAKLQIWNRWGKKIYKNDSYQNEWGTQKEIVAGLYYYLYETPSGAICKGWIQVMK